jgi:hypothetical protein
MEWGFSRGVKDMRRSLLMRAALTAVVLSAAVPTRAADVIVGQLVDSACNMTMGKTELVLAPDHLKCAIACAQKGGRLAVVTEKGEVYAVTGPLTQENNAKLIPYVNQKVTLTGTLGVFKAVADIVPPPPGKVAPPDKRRPTGTEDGVVTKTVRKGDFREGDVSTGSEPSIEVLSIALVPAIRGIVP